MGNDAASAIGLASWQVIAAASIFLLAYGIIVVEKINRAVIALAGAVLLMVLGVIDYKTAWLDMIGWQMIFLWTGMMLLIGLANRSGLLQYLAIKVVKAARCGPKRILIWISLLTAIVSTFLDNVSIVLLVVPVTLAITDKLRIPAVPYLIATIMSANIGGAASLLGNKGNMMIGTANPQLSFPAFIQQLGPIALAIWLVTIGMLLLIYRKKLHATYKDRMKLQRFDAMSYIHSRKLAIRTAIILIAAFLAFVCQPLHGLPPAAIAWISATLLLVFTVSRQEMHTVPAMVEWKGLFFFAGLYLLAGGLVQAGIIQFIGRRAMEMAQGDQTFIAVMLLWTSGIIAATADNVPFVAAAIPFIQEIGVQLGVEGNAPVLAPLWLALAMGASFGSNGTLSSTSANVIAVGLAAKEGTKFSYGEFLRVGAPLTVVALAMATGYIYWLA